MGIAVQIAQILFILSVLVILHELGHYLTARWFKVRAEKFYLFMDAGFSLFKKKIGDTEWGIGWLPIGGYVKLAGMMDESLDKDQLKEPPKPDEFRAKPAWQRLIILLGGIIVNILLAIIIYTVMFATVGKKYPSTEQYQKNGLSFTDVGQNMGFQNGDKILSVDGKYQNRFDRMVIDVLLGDDILVDRGGEKIHIHLTDENIKDILSKEGRGFIQSRYPAIVDSLLQGSNAQKAGLQKGDKVVEINHAPIQYYDQVKPQLLGFINRQTLDKKNTNPAQDTIQIKVERDGNIVPIKTKVSRDGTLGYFNRLPDSNDLITVEKMPLGSAFVNGLEEAYTMFVYNIKQFKLLLKPKTEAYKQIKSPVGITRELPQTWNWEFVWKFMAFFSIALAFINLLPIPGLDGGHALFTLVEMISGKTMNEKTAGIVQTAGMIFLLSLMALTFGKDIWEIVVDNL